MRKRAYTRRTRRRGWVGGCLAPRAGSWRGRGGPLARRWETRCRVIGRSCGSRNLGPGVGDGPEHLVALGVDGPDGVQVAVRRGLGVEFLERDAGLEAFFDMGKGAQLVVARLDVGGRVDVADAAVGALALGGEQAGPVVVEVRRQVLPSERVDARRESLEGMKDRFARSAKTPRSDYQDDLKELCTKTGELVVERDFLQCAFDR